MDTLDGGGRAWVAGGGPWVRTRRGQSVDVTRLDRPGSRGDLRARAAITAAPGTEDEGTWNYSSNSVKQLARVEDPRGKEWAYAYDDYGRLTSVTNPVGTRAFSVYDKAGRKTEVRVEDKEENLLAKTEYVRDLAGRVTQVGEVVQMI